MQKNEAKKRAGEAACTDLKSGMILGLGTGSTAYYAIERVGQLVASGMDLKAVATSKQTEQLALDRGIPLLPVQSVTRLDVVIDGVDEIDPRFHAIKGGGGALFREKVVALLGEEVIWVLDESKRVPHLGCFPLPLEVLPFALTSVLCQLESLGLCPRLRCLPGQVPEDWEYAGVLRQSQVILDPNDQKKIWWTDNGNCLVDLCNGEALDAPYLEKQLRPITGILETGLFLNLASKICVGTETGVEIVFNPNHR